jgi:cytochrome c553
LRTLSFRFAAPALAMILAAASLAVAADQDPPPWAFVVNPPGLAAAADDGTPHRVPGSERAFTLTQIRDLFAVPDWHPGDHPPMPEIVAHGRRPAVLACGYCHLPNGLGRPENSSLAGLPAEYIVQQVKDFQSGARRSSEARSLPVNFMISTASAVSDEELRVAAAYFAALEPQPWIRVVETPTVPKTQVLGWMLAAADASSRCRNTWSAPNCATRAPASSPTCRPAASHRAARSPKATASRAAPHATASA